MSDTEREIAIVWERNFPLHKLEDSFELSLLSRFLEFLKLKNEAGGFFSKKDTAIILERHLLECIYFVWFLKERGFVSRETTILDFGTGPGLPGFLFACLKNPPQLALLDSQRRKLSLLETFVISEPLPLPIRFLYQRVEELDEQFHLITCRAVVPYPWSAEVISRAVSRQGYFIPFLGVDHFGEPREKAILDRCGLQLRGKEELSDLEFLGKRHIRVLQKTHSEKKGTPRPWKEIQKEIQIQNEQNHIHKQPEGGSR